MLEYPPPQALEVYSSSTVSWVCWGGCLCWILEVDLLLLLFFYISSVFAARVCNGKRLNILR